MEDLLRFRQTMKNTEIAHECVDKTSLLKLIEATQQLPGEPASPSFVVTAPTWHTSVSTYSKSPPPFSEAVATLGPSTLPTRELQDSIIVRNSNGVFLLQPIVGKTAGRYHNSVSFQASLDVSASSYSPQLNGLSSTAPPPYTNKQQCI